MLLIMSTFWSLKKSQGFSFSFTTFLSLLHDVSGIIFHESLCQYVVWTRLLSWDNVRCFTFWRGLPCWFSRELRLMSSSTTAFFCQFQAISSDFSGFSRANWIAFSRVFDGEFDALKRFSWASFGALFWSSWRPVTWVCLVHNVIHEIAFYRTLFLV